MRSIFLFFSALLIASKTIFAADSDVIDQIDEALIGLISSASEQEYDISEESSVEEQRPPAKRLRRNDENRREQKRSRQANNLQEIVLCIPVPVNDNGNDVDAFKAIGRNIAASNRQLSAHAIAPTNTEKEISDLLFLEEREEVRRATVFSCNEHLAVIEREDDENVLVGFLVTSKKFCETLCFDLYTADNKISFSIDDAIKKIEYYPYQRIKELFVQDKAPYILDDRTKLNTEPWQFDRARALPNLSLTRIAFEKLTALKHGRAFDRGTLFWKNSIDKRNVFFYLDDNKFPVFLVTLETALEKKSASALRAQFKECVLADYDETLSSNLEYGSYWLGQDKLAIVFYPQNYIRQPEPQVIVPNSPNNPIIVPNSPNTPVDMVTRVAELQKSLSEDSFDDEATTEDPHLNEKDQPQEVAAMNVEQQRSSSEDSFDDEVTTEDPRLNENDQTKEVAAAMNVEQQRSSSEDSFDDEATIEDPIWNAQDSLQEFPEQVNNKEVIPERTYLDDIALFLPSELEQLLNDPLMSSVFDDLP